MNFEQALKEMIKGNRVRLSDWMGYWFMNYIPSCETEDGMPKIIDINWIKVFTRDGDILDTPNFDRYKDRDDWELVTETGWSFDMALRFMKNGKEVKRVSWSSGGGMKIINGEIFSSIEYIPDLNEWLNGVVANDWEIVNA